MRRTLLIFWLSLPAILYGQLNDIRHFMPLQFIPGPFGHAQISAKRLYLTDIYHLAASFYHGTENWRIGHLSQGWTRPGYIESNTNLWVTRRIMKTFTVGIGGLFYTLNADEAHLIRINSEIILKCSPNSRTEIRFTAQNLLSHNRHQSIPVMPRLSWQSLFRLSPDYQGQFDYCYACIQSSQLPCTEFLFTEKWMAAFLFSSRCSSSNWLRYIQTFRSASVR